MSQTPCYTLHPEGIVGDVAEIVLSSGVWIFLRQTMGSDKGGWGSREEELQIGEIKGDFSEEAAYRPGGGERAWLGRGRKGGLSRQPGLW